MANWGPPLEVSPWRRRGLKIPPDSFREWVRLGTWEFGMGVLLYVVFYVGTQLIASAPHSIVTVFDFTNCYAAPPVTLPCERVAYRVGGLNAVLNAWCGLLLMAVAAWLVWRENGFAEARVPLSLFGVQLVFNALWSWLFFAWQRGRLAELEILLLLALIALTVVAFWRVRPLAGALLLPYLLWVAFASALTFAIVRRNPALFTPPT